MAACGSGIAAAVSGKGAGDDAAHTMFPGEDLAGNAAVFVEGLGRDNVFMGRYLEHAVG